VRSHLAWRGRIQTQVGAVAVIRAGSTIAPRVAVACVAVACVAAACVPTGAVRLVVERWLA
jgi:hypothetical protein